MEDFRAAFPPTARAAGVMQARVLLTCSVGAEGLLEGCKADSEEPKGYGYADAALRLSGAFRLDIWTAEGLPTVGAAVRVPIRFDMQVPAKP